MREHLLSEQADALEKLYLLAAVKVGEESPLAHGLRELLFLATEGMSRVEASFEILDAFDAHFAAQIKMRIPPQPNKGAYVIDQNYEVLEGSVVTVTDEGAVAWLLIPRNGNHPLMMKACRRPNGAYYLDGDPNTRVEFAQ